VVSFILTWRDRATAAFFVFSININAAVLFFNLYYPPQSGPFLYYFPLAVSIILLNIPHVRNTQSLFYLGTFVFCFVAKFALDIPGLQLSNLSYYQMRAIWYYDFILAVVVTLIISYVLTRVIMDQNNEIISRNEGLMRTKEQLATALKEKQMLLAELHHRTKNNLAIISSMLNLQLETAKNNEARQVIAENRNRIQSMALVHRMLHESPVQKKIDIGKYASALISELFSSYNLGHVKIFEDHESVSLPVENTIPIGLIINEFVTNSIKHAYKASRRGEAWFRSTIRTNGGYWIQCTLRDNGSGFHDHATGNGNETLGLSLIRSLAEQLDGEVQFSNENGFRLDLRLPVHHVANREAASV
jgi:two-component sensor histidine kinase